MKTHPLKVWRKSKGLKLLDAAKLVGVTKECWRQWEKGGRIPHQSHMRRLGQATSGKVRPEHFYAPTPPQLAFANQCVVPGCPGTRKRPYELCRHHLSISRAIRV